MIYHTNSLGEALKHVLDTKAKNNSKFSLRSLARKTELSPAAISRVIHHKLNLGVEKAEQVAELLNFKDQEKEYFLTLAKLDSEKDPEIRSILQRKLYELGRNTKSDKISGENFDIISEWYGLPMFDLIRHAPAHNLPTVASLAEKLGISHEETERMVKNLVQLKLIEEVISSEVELTPEETGAESILANAIGHWGNIEVASVAKFSIKTKLKSIAERVIISSNSLQKSMGKYYQQILSLISRSLTEQTPQEKVIGFQILMIDPEQIEVARNLTDQYLNALGDLSIHSKTRSEVYQAFSCVFRIGKKNINSNSSNSSNSNNNMKNISEQSNQFNKNKH